MSVQDLSQDPQAVDVSTPETHYLVQCSQVSLVDSILKPIEDYDKVDVSRFLFKIKITVEHGAALAYLHVQVAAMSDTPFIPGCSLNFTLMGIFRAEGEMPPEALGDFARHYTLSILWPYAREYTADQLRRAGLPFDELPIINPQVVTEKLIEANLIEVKIFSEDDEDVTTDQAIE
jgi:preprotein translocase subunit SecB